jgi:hypothetical protein
MPNRKKKTTPAQVQVGDAAALIRAQFQQLTTEPVKAGDFGAVLPEFGRTPDATRTFGLKRGTLYNLLADRKIKGVVLRSRGQTSGCRLWDMGSIRDYIRHCQREQEPVT